MQRTSDRPSQSASSAGKSTVCMPQSQSTRAFAPRAQPGLPPRRGAVPDVGSPGIGRRRGLADSPAMFVTFFHELKSAGLPVTLREYLTLMDAMEADFASRRV